MLKLAHGPFFENRIALGECIAFSCELLKFMYLEENKVVNVGTYFKKKSFECRKGRKCG